MRKWFENLKRQQLCTCFLTAYAAVNVFVDVTFLYTFSKLPMRQLTHMVFGCSRPDISKLPMRQLTNRYLQPKRGRLSKLPMRQLTEKRPRRGLAFFSKLPMRQLTLTF